MQETYSATVFIKVEEETERAPQFEELAESLGIEEQIEYFRNEYPATSFREAQITVGFYVEDITAPQWARIVEEGFNILSN